MKSEICTMTYLAFLLVFLLDVGAFVELVVGREVWEVKAFLADTLVGPSSKPQPGDMLALGAPGIASVDYMCTRASEEIVVVGVDKEEE